MAGQAQGRHAVRGLINAETGSAEHAAYAQPAPAVVVRNQHIHALVPAHVVKQYPRSRTFSEAARSRRLWRSTAAGASSVAAAYVSILTPGRATSATGSTASTRGVELRAAPPRRW